MPVYAYRCKDCKHEFEEMHAIDDDTLIDCPECESENVERLINSAPTIAGGMSTPAGTSRGATHEELRRKWREETPKLRRKLRDRLGDDAMKDLPLIDPSGDDKS